MECPICNIELVNIDYYGRVCSHQDGKIIGDIYQCQNEDCKGFQEYYHVERDNPEDLKEGYPC